MTLANIGVIGERRFAHRIVQRNALAGAQDVVMVEWVFDAGNWYDKQPMVAATTNFLIKNGTTSKTAYQINDFFEFHGAYLNRSCYNETASLTLHCLSKHLETLLPVVCEIIETSIFFFCFSILFSIF